MGIQPDGTFTEYTYGAYGKITYNSTDNSNPFTYCGEYTDTETGLVYLRNRYYDPELGRFLTQDPAMDGFNWYVYCAGDPVNYIDPSGENGFFTMVKSGVEKIGNVTKSMVKTAVDTSKNIVKKSATIVVETAENKIDNSINTVGVIVSKTSKLDEKHYERNENNTDIPQKESDVSNDWIAGVPANCHQFTASEESGNVKYISSDGHKEAIFDSNGILVNVPEDEGTYNYFSPTEDQSLHLICDVVPWIIWGNSPEDTTTPSQRVWSCVPNTISKPVEEIYSYVR